MNPEIVLEQTTDSAAEDAPSTLDAIKPQTEFGARLLALAKEIDQAGTPKLSLDEIEEYLGRELGCIAEAVGESGCLKR